MKKYISSCLIIFLILILFGEQGAIAADFPPRDFKCEERARNQGDEKPNLSAEDIKQKLLALMNRAEGHIGRDDVESTFGSKMQERAPRKSDPLDFKNYHFDDSRNHISVSLSTYKGGAESSFGFDWIKTECKAISAVLPSPPPGMCIHADDFFNDITKAGWDLQFEQRWGDIAPANAYEKGDKGWVRIFFRKSSQCVLSVDIAFTSQRPAYFQKK
jgi:hypothetical protein